MDDSAAGGGIVFVPSRQRLCQFPALSLGTGICWRANSIKGAVVLLGTTAAQTGERDIQCDTARARRGNGRRVAAAAAAAATVTGGGDGYGYSSDLIRV
jgi:hypothetical protein